MPLWLLSPLLRWEVLIAKKLPFGELLPLSFFPQDNVLDNSIKVFILSPIPEVKGEKKEVQRNLFSIA